MIGMKKGRKNGRNMFGYDQGGISWWPEIAKKSRTEARNIPGYRPGRTRCRNRDRLKARRWKDQSVERCFSCEKTSEIRRADTSPSWINSQSDEADTPPSWWINKFQRSWRLYPKSVKRSCWQCSAEVWEHSCWISDQQRDEALNHQEEAVDTPEPSYDQSIPK